MANASPTARAASLAHDRGAFTWLELLGLVAVSATLVAVVVSAYRTHSVRAEVVSAIDHTGALRAAITEAFARGETPDDLPESVVRFGRALRHPYIASIELANGRIDVTFGNGAAPAIAGRRLSLTPYETTELEVIWICGNEIPPAGVRPLGFAAGARQPVQIPTTVEARYLPPSCR